LRRADFARSAKLEAERSGDVMAQVPRLIKKYPNRRLYDTQTSTYITLADVKQLVLGHEDFQVVDAKSQEDLTRAILLQIILEEESGGMPMFTSPMLSHMIRFYGNAMQGMMGVYLEKNIQAFMDIQDKLKDQLGDPSRPLYEGKVLGTELWSQFLAGQAPVMQSMMGNYMEQSKNMFMQMQEQMQTQTRSMFGQTFNFPAPAGATGTNGANGVAPVVEKAKK
jgi:polyhydroxyalkanoate synthesis repressor PhaR